MVTVTLDVSSTKTISDDNPIWIGDVTCLFSTAAGVVTGSGRVPVVYGPANEPFASGGSMTVVANVPAGITSALTCELTETSTDAADPNVSVQVRGATGVSINTLDSAYSNFIVPTVPPPP